MATASARATPGARTLYTAQARTKARAREPVRGARCTSILVGVPLLVCASLVDVDGVLVG
eukprot:1846175-Prymnesium_polylepis.2